jgi:hypothetical protein
VAQQLQQLLQLYTQEQEQQQQQQQEVLSVQPLQHPQLMQLMLSGELLLLLLVCGPAGLLLLPVGLSIRMCTVHHCYFDCLWDAVEVVFLWSRKCVAAGTTAASCPATPGDLPHS